MIPRPQRAEVPDHVRDLLIDVAHGHFVCEPIHFARLSGGDWDGRSLAGYDGTLSVAGSALRLIIHASEATSSVLYDLFSLRNKPATLTLRDGSAVVAELAHMRSFGEKADVELHHWTWSGEKTPICWLARIEGKLPSFGNLSLAEHGDRWRKTLHDGFCFQGRHVWYVLPATETATHNVVLDADGEPLDRAALINDFLALQFAVGGGLRLDYFTGLDVSRNAVAAISLAGFARPNSNYRPPVPHGLDEAQIWLPEYFKLVASKLSADGLEPLVIPIAAYLDAESDHLDGGYLKAQVGLEAFAKRLVGEDPKELLVKDENEWKRWIGSLKKDIRGHLKDPKKLDSVVGKFITAVFASSSGRVARAFSVYGVSLPDEVHEEIRKRNYPAHGFFMNKTADHDVDVDARRLELIQTVLAALVALYVGYQGPLHGYEVAADGGRLPPEWWQVRTSTQAAWIRYFGERYVPGPRPQEQTSARQDARHNREQTIRERAYFLWRNRTGTAWWDQTSNWLEAERAEATGTD